MISSTARLGPSTASGRVGTLRYTIIPSSTSIAALPQTILTDSSPLATSVVAAPRLGTKTLTPTAVGATSKPEPQQAATATASSTSTPQPSLKRDIHPGAIAAIALGAITIVLLSILVAVLARKRRRRRERQMERIHELPLSDKNRGGSSRLGASSRAGMSEKSGARYPGPNLPRTAQVRWDRERGAETCGGIEGRRDRVELESGWGPPEIDSKRLHGKSAYVSPRVSVPPKSRVVSEYI